MNIATPPYQPSRLQESTQAYEYSYTTISAIQVAKKYREMNIATPPYISAIQVAKKYREMNIATQSSGSCSILVALRMVG